LANQKAIFGGFYSPQEYSWCVGFGNLPLFIRYIKDANSCSINFSLLIYLLRKIGMHLCKLHVFFNVQFFPISHLLQFFTFYPVLGMARDASIGRWNCRAAVSSSEANNMGLTLAGATLPHWRGLWLKLKRQPFGPLHIFAARTGNPDQTCLPNSNN